MALYVDINPDYGTEPDLILTDAYAIEKSILNLINTAMGQRYRRLLVGSRLLQLLFDDLSSITAFSIELELLDIIAQEPRCKVVRSLLSVIPDYENNQYDVTIGAELFGLGTPVNFKLALKRP